MVSDISIPVHPFRTVHGVTPLLMVLDRLGEGSSLLFSEDHVENTGLCTISLARGQHDFGIRVPSSFDFPIEILFWEVCVQGVLCDTMATQGFDKSALWLRTCPET